MKEIIFSTTLNKITMGTLSGKKIAILSDTGFEQSELLSPQQALLDAGATVHIVSKVETLTGWDEKNWGKEINRDADLASANPEDYDALLIPGGVINPDHMRNDADYVKFATHFLESGKPLAAICHGPQLLIETGMLHGRSMTSYPSIKTDLKNAGVIWEDAEVVTDNGLITSRSPKDLPAFNKKIVEVFAEGQQKTTAAFTSEKV